MRGRIRIRCSRPSEVGCVSAYFQSEIIIPLLKDYVSQLSSGASKWNAYFCTPESGSLLSIRNESKWEWDLWTVNRTFPFRFLSSVQFSRSVVSASLQPYESQHARPPCPSPTSGVVPQLTNKDLLCPTRHQAQRCISIIQVNHKIMESQQIKSPMIWEIKRLV